MVAAAGAANTRIAAEPSAEIAPLMPVPVAVMSGSKHRAEAEKSVGFLLSAEAQGALNEYLLEAPRDETEGSVRAPAGGSASAVE